MGTVDIDHAFAAELIEMCEGKTEEELFEMLGDKIVEGVMENEGLTREEAVKVLLGRLSDA